MNTPISDRAEKLVRLRSVLAIVLGTILIASQGQRMDDGGGGLVSWVLSGIIVLVFLVWASGIFRGKVLRGVLNDESSEVHRKRSLMIAFWNMMATAAVCYALTYVKDYGPRDAIQIIMTVGISSALISFGGLERIALRS